MALLKIKGVWHIRLQYKNRCIKRTTKTANKTLAKRLESQFFEELITEEHFKEGKSLEISFNDFASLYFKKHSIHKRSCAKADTIYLKHLCNYFGDNKLHNIKRTHVREYQALRREKVGNATVNREVSCLKTMFNRAIDWNQDREDVGKTPWDLPQVNPVRGVIMLKETERGRYASDDEIAKLLTHSGNDVIKDFIIIALNTGLRKGEVQGINIERDVDFNTGVLLLPHTKAGVKQSVPMNALVRHTLSKYKGEPFKHNPRQAFETVCKKGGVENLRIHDLRHTFATILMTLDVNLYIISGLLRHSSMGKLQITARYTQIVDKELHAAVEKLHSYFTKFTHLL